MNGPTRSYINLVIRVTKNGVVIKSGGSTYEVVFGKKPTIFVLPKEVKQIYGQWDSATKKYITLTSYGEVLLLDDDVAPSSLNLCFKYTGEAARKFIMTLNDILKKYYRGGQLLRLPLSDKIVMRLAIYLARMSQLQSISDVV